MTIIIKAKQNEFEVSRRKVVTGVAATSGLLLAGCSKSSNSGGEGSTTLAKLRERFKKRPTSDAQVKSEDQPKIETKESTFASLYGPLPNEKFPVPAVPEGELEERFFRQRVDYRTDEKVGSLIVDTKNFYLYHVEPNNKAMRYGVGLGKAGFEWAGRARVLWKQEWPKWTPPAEMIERRPELEKWSEENGGMPGGLDNPLGARALYIFEGNVDTLYRLHGTPEHWSIGKAVSSGCVRMIHQDVIDLYGRVKTKSPILVK